MSDRDRSGGLAALSRDAKHPAAGLGVGTALFGLGGVDQDEASRIVRTAVDAGVRYFDTAPLYGFGTAERVLGSAIRDIDPDSIVISTKVGRLVDDESRTVRFDLSRDGIRRAWEASLARLGLDRVDIAYLHDPEVGGMEQALNEAFPAMAELRSHGEVRAIGVGVNDVETALRFVRECDIDLVLIAGRFTVLDRSAAVELIPLAAARGVSLVVGGVFNSGVLATGSTTSTFDYLPPDDETMKRVAALARVCASFGVPLRTAALRFPQREPAVVSTLVGVASLAQLADGLHDAAAELPPELWEALDACVAERGAA